MIEFLYQSIYILLVSAGLYSSMLLYTDDAAMGIPAFLSASVLGLLILLFKESRASVRLILSALIISPAVVVFIGVRNGHIAFSDEAIMTAIKVILIALLAFIIGELSCHFRYVRIVISFISLIFFILSFFTEVKASRIFVLFAFFFILITVFEEIQRRWKREGKQDNRSRLVFVFPFLLITMMGVFLSPVSDDPYDWHIVRGIYSDIADAINRMKWKNAGNTIFDPSITLIGFSEKGEIHGDITSSYDAQVMQLTKISWGVNELRIAGKSFDTFNGRSWDKTDMSADEGSELDTIALVASVNSYADNADDLIKESHYRITNIATEYFFRPVKTERIIQEGSAANTDVYFYSLNYDNEQFKDYLCGAHIPSDEEFNAALEELYGDGKDITYADYLRYNKEMYGIYQQSPALSYKLRALMDDVYEGADSDPEKMERLNAFFDTFTYTERPGDLPESVSDESSFLDYFILESKCGYCSHFATAFVLLARAEGLPARYVQGYYVPDCRLGKADVLNSMAHAWAEVYYEGAGWVTYDPTPGYNVSSYWRTGAQSDPSLYYMHQPSSETGSYGAGSASDDAENDTLDVHLDKRWIIIPCICVLFITVLLLGLYRIIRIVSFGRKSAYDKYIYICRQIFIIMKLLGFGFIRQETLYEYKERIPEDTLSDDFCDLLCRVLYRGDEVSSEALSGAGEIKTRLLGSLKKENLFRYLLFQIGIYPADY